MIEIFNDIINSKECDEFVEFFKKNKELMYSQLSDNIYHFNAVSIIDNINEFSFTKKYINLNTIDRIRIQHIDNNVNTVERAHMHNNPYTIIVFLNDEYNGGELIFNNITIRPKKGQLIYFTGNEYHLVNKVSSGDRYTLVCFLKHNIDFLKNFKSVV